VAKVVSFIVLCIFSSALSLVVGLFSWWLFNHNPYWAWASFAFSAIDNYFLIVLRRSIYSGKIEK
jgi:hypothetical protein